MAARLDAPDLAEVLRLTPPGQNILLMGRHGIGKSEILTAHYGKLGVRVVALFLGQMSDPGDLIGLPHKDEATGRTVFLPPHWWPVDGKAIVLFLDELNRARPELLQAVQDLALNRQLAGKPLPPGSSVIAAVNAGDEYQLTDLDPALVSRFNLYEFAPTPQDWLLWAGRNGVDERVSGFIQKNTHFLDGESVDAEQAMATSGLVKTPDRRAWVKVSDFVKQHRQLEPLHFTIITGIVGAAAALAFRQYVSKREQIDPAEFFGSYSKLLPKLKKMAQHEVVQLNEQLLLWLEAHPLEGKAGDAARKAFLAWLEHLKSVGFTEAIAHAASLAMSPKFSNAMGQLSVSLTLMTFLTDYIEGIKL
jgi:AAA domain (dynein-related subfamily)